MTGAVSIGSGLVSSDTEALEMLRADFLATLTDMVSNLAVMCAHETVGSNQGVLLDGRMLVILEALVRKGLPQDEMAEKGVDTVTLVRNELMRMVEEAIATRCFGIEVWIDHFEMKPSGGRKHTAPYVAFKRVTS